MNERQKESQRLTELANKLADPDGTIRQRHFVQKNGRNQTADAAHPATLTGKTMTKNAFIARGLKHFDEQQHRQALPN